MHRRDFIAGGAAALLPPNAAWAQAGDAARDIEILEAAYTQLHPGLTRYATPAALSARFRALKRAFAEDRPLADKYLALSRMLATIQCGHTYANFYNQSRAVRAALFDGGGRLPFWFRWIEGRMIVTRDQSDDALAVGSEIVAIDGRAPRAILRALLAYARADGGNDAKRRALMEVRGKDRYETFDVFCNLLYPARDNGYDLRVRAPGTSRVRDVRAASIDLAKRRSAMAGDRDADAPRWTLSDVDGVAVLNMPDWALYNSKWDWRAFLDETFASIERARGLVIDLRGNEGGLDCGHEIVARLIDTELRLIADERRVRFRTTPPDLDPFLDTWDDSFRSLGAEGVDLGDGFFRLPPEDGVTSIRPKGPRFRAPVIVLVDAANSSATFQFAQVMQQNRLGRLYGAPTGGNKRGVNGGAFFFVRLPVTGLEADLPLIGRFPLTPQPNRGLTPDILVEDGVPDIAAARDRVMDTALQALGLTRITPPP